MTSGSRSRSALARASLLLVSTLAVPGTAQEVLRQAPVPGPVRNAGVYHVATGEWTRSQQAYGLLDQDVLYRNDLGTGYFGLLDENDVAFYEGRLPGKGQPLRAGHPEAGTSDSYRITGFQFGYCALTDRPTTYTLTFREAYAPCHNPSNYPVTATFVHSGLPNRGCWVVAFDLTGSSHEFTLAAEGGDGSWDQDNDRDDFGYAVNLDHDQGDGAGQLIAGPIAAGRNDLAHTYGDGTVFKNPSLGGTGLGSEDLFWLTSVVVADGCYFYSCCHRVNANLALFGVGDSVTSYCHPGSANSVAAGGAELSSVGGFGTSAASFLVTGTPDQPGMLFTGPDQMQTPFGCGDRCVGGVGTVRYGPFFPAGNTVRPTIDMSLTGNKNIQWWYRDPANAGACGAPFNLSNALGL